MLLGPIDGVDSDEETVNSGIDSYSGCQIIDTNLGIYIIDCDWESDHL